MPTDKHLAFSIIASVQRREGQEPLTEAKMKRLLQQLVRDWEHGAVTVWDVIEKKPQPRE